MDIIILFMFVLYVFVVIISMIIIYMEYDPFLPLNGIYVSKFNMDSLVQAKTLGVTGSILVLLSQFHSF